MHFNFSVYFFFLHQNVVFLQIFLVVDEDAVLIHKVNLAKKRMRKRKEKENRLC